MKARRANFGAFMMTPTVRHEKRSHGKRGCQCAALIGDGRAAEFLLLEQFSNGLNAYTRGKGSGTSTENDTASISGLQRSSQSGSRRLACSGPDRFREVTFSQKFDGFLISANPVSRQFPDCDHPEGGQTAASTVAQAPKQSRQQFRSADSLKTPSRVRYPS